LPTIETRDRPFVYVVRFCGTEESSVASAIRQGIGVLDNFLAWRKAAAPDELIVAYRNRIPGGVTLQIGFPVEQSVADAPAGEVFAGRTPAGSMVEILHAGSLGEVLGVGARLPEGSSSFTWQAFRSRDFRPWRTHPSTPLFVPAELAAAATTSPEPS
jgi:hypothetical protein